ncbi:MAG: LacI family transcriptional regulator [Eubacterium sp.]|nr:LacI family transcriptional regulator [Eubacterium sp.]
MQEQEGKKLTMDDVAKALGVSKTTVSRAVSGKGRIGEQTRQKVLEYIAQHNYKPNVMAKGLANKRTYNIGMVLQADLLSSDLPFFPKALKGISEAAAKEAYDVILTLVDTNDLSRLARVIEDQKVDGLILMRTLQDDKPAEMLKKSGLPFVAMGMTDDPYVCQVDHDHVEACRELTGILLMKGLKKIALIVGDMNHVINKKRLEGFCAAHKELGFALDESLIFMDVDSQLLADRVTDMILMRGVSCMIGADDLLASQVLNRLEEEGVQIPREMRLASFHDSQLLKSAGTGITAIRFHTEELGREACRVLLRQINGEEVPHLTKLSYEVAIRGSTK